jgi:hypothetical protein
VSPGTDVVTQPPMPRGAGQVRASVGPTGRSVLSASDKPEPAVILGWRAGRLIVERPGPGEEQDAVSGMGRVLLLGQRGYRPLRSVAGW